MKIATAPKDGSDKEDKPQMPCPDVQPFDKREP
jgi:hypothetical protein